MQRKVNQAIFAILAMTTIWLTVHTSKINSMSPDVKVLNRIQFQDLPIITSGEAVSVEEMEFEILDISFPETTVHAQAVNIGKTPCGT